jgi:hypothetical protein
MACGALQCFGMLLKKRFIVNEKGTRIGVPLSFEDYQSVFEELAELEAIRPYEAVKMSGTPRRSDYNKSIPAACWSIPRPTRVGLIKGRSPFRLSNRR